MNVAHPLGRLAAQAGRVEIIDLAGLGVEQVEGIGAQPEAVGELVAVRAESSIVGLERTLLSSISARGPK
jgi:hypothetical protein